MNKDILKICDKKLTQEENNMLDLYIDNLLNKQKESLNITKIKEMVSDKIENKNKEILNKISQEEAEFLMEQSACSQVCLIIQAIYTKDLLLILKEQIEEKLK